MCRSEGLGLLECHDGLMHVVAREAVAAVDALVQRANQRLLRLWHRDRRLSVLPEGLANPHLRHPLGAERGHAGVQRVHVELAIHEAREKDDRRAAPWLDLQVQPAEEGSATALGHVVQVHEHRSHALAAQRAEGPAGYAVRVDAIVVLDVALPLRVPRHLRQLHVAKRLACEGVHLAEQHWARHRRLGKVARERRAAACRLRPGGCVRLGALQQRAGHGDERLALGIA
mmetsp:Transcript_23596/g.76257  ORF Transcript_23596/g.76257 Transcript_23596/m.76257 type:complete len:229 (+) Transcript_23596:634-1320(+)